MKILTRNIFEMVFYSVLSIVLISLFAISVVQGFMVQLSEGSVLEAFLMYSAGLISLLFVFVLYLRAKRLTKVLSQSEVIWKLLEK